MLRTHEAGTLRAADIDATVTVAGWIDARRDHGGVVFLDLRDHAGLLQVVVDPAQAGLDAVHRLRSEFVVRVTGVVRARPEGTVNPDLATGEVEVAATTLDVLAECDPLPFQLDSDDVDEVLRLRHRYLDLRRPRMQHNLKIRSQVNHALRTSMEAQGFTEVETPMLIASTPEGSRDFVVPSRLRPGSFYALPQSPQLLKQLLMVGGVPRYYQIARCLRDEDLRADRQFEFMQLDLEIAFAEQEDVLAAVTEAVVSAVEAVQGDPPAPVERITWHDAMTRFGSDKPDVRFGMELVDLGDVFATTEFRAFAGNQVKGICVARGAEFSRSKLDALTDRAKQLGAAGLVWMRVQEGEQAPILDSPVAKFLTDDEKVALVDALHAAPGDLLLLVAGPEWTKVAAVLGQLRLDLGKPPVSAGGLRFLWVVDFPLYEGIDDSGKPIPAHHAFTMPNLDDLPLLDSGDPADLLKVRSQSYDLVCNGWELGSGSVRIHRRDIQQKIFATIGLDEASAQARFGFLLDAFKYGPPPHAGFAVGIDRLVALIAGEENIREVIAYPKTQSGSDPLTNAPTPIDAAQLDELGLRVLPPKT